MGIGLSGYCGVPPVAIRRKDERLAGTLLFFVQKRLFDQSLKLFRAGDCGVEHSVDSNDGGEAGQWLDGSKASNGFVGLATLRKA